MYEKWTFPEGFFWGAATASHQVEGNNHNDWTEWEKINSHRLLTEAEKYWNKWHEERFGILKIDNFISGMACDHYNRFEEDFDLAESLGHNAHRFSIEWSRIEPTEGVFNEDEIEHYRKMLWALRERGIEPFVTLWHFTNPLWIRDITGWENKKTVEYFLRYAEKIADTLGTDIKFWIPINEPSVYSAYSYLYGAWPPQVKSVLRCNRVLKNLAKANKKVYKLLHKKFGDKVVVGSSHNLHYHAAYRRWWFLDKLAARIVNYLRDIRILKMMAGYVDFIGLNYYYRDTVKFVLWGGKYGIVDIKNPNLDVSDMGWDICPEGIYNVLLSLKKYKKPIYITENGIADAKDEKRAKFIKEHLYWTNLAIKKGVDVRGYFYWSLLDNFVWDKGFWPRFGLVEIDYNTMERKVRDSAYEYAQICKDNALVI